MVQFVLSFNSIFTLGKFTIDDPIKVLMRHAFGLFYGHYWIWYHVFLWLKNLPKSATYS